MRQSVVVRTCTALLLLLTLAACSSSGLSGKYETDPGSGYGFEFDGDTVYSLVGDTSGQGTFTVDGETVRVCFLSRCTDLTMEGSCLVGFDGGRYCKS